MAEATVAAQPKQRAVIITSDRFHPAESANQRWVINAEPSHEPEDIENPTYYAHVAEKLTVYDHIEVRAETGEWIAWLVVTGCGDGWARVKAINVVRLDPSKDMVKPADAAQHYVAWKGPQHKYCVIRKQDGHRVSEGHKTQGSAEEWMREQERTLRRAA